VELHDARTPGGEREAGDQSEREKMGKAHESRLAKIDA
jgi:hypothetical protein